MQISVRVDDKVSVGLEKLGSSIPKITSEEVQDGLEQAVKEARGGYPDGSYSGYTVPTLPQQGYVRRGELGRGTYWTREGASYRIRSDTPYSRYVIGDARGEGQAVIHRGRWPVAYQVMRKWADTMVERIRDKIRRTGEALGL